ESRYRQLTEVVPFGDTFAFGGNFKVPLGKAAFYANGTLSTSELRSTGTYRNENNVVTILNASPEGGYVPVLDTEQLDYQAVAGFRGNGLAGWRWDLSGSYGGNRARMYVNGINASFGGTHPYHDFYIGQLRADEFVANLD